MSQELRLGVLQAAAVLWASGRLTEREAVAMAFNLWDEVCVEGAHRQKLAELEDLPL